MDGWEGKEGGRDGWGGWRMEEDWRGRERCGLFACANWCVEVGGKDVVGSFSVACRVSKARISGYELGVTAPKYTNTRTMLTEEAQNKTYINPGGGGGNINPYADMRSIYLWIGNGTVMMMVIASSG
jgi:hypothetical protein